MNKPKKDSKHNIIELAAKRWSPRAFDDKQIPQEDLLKIMEAGRWAPSSYNEQPWRFIYASKHDNRQAYDQLFDCLAEGNQGWAQTAPILIIGASKLTFTKNDKSNKHCRYDLGQAVAWMTAQAMSMDIFIHQMAGFDAQKAKEDLAIPEGYEAVVAFSMGYIGDEQDFQELSEGMQEAEYKEQQRKPMSEIAFNGKWKS